MRNGTGPTAILALLLATVVATNTPAGTYYVATDGKGENDGSEAKPWPSISDELSKVGGGHTIIVKPGIYRGPFIFPRGTGGTKERPTIIKSEVKWKAVIIGAESHCIFNGSDCDYVVVDGFEVHGAHKDGIKLAGDHNVVRNCWTHHNGAMGIAVHNRNGTVIENNLIEFNGAHPAFHHGIYACGEGLVVRGNIIRHNAAYGIHLYERVKNSVVANNLVYGQVNDVGILLYCEGDGHNTVVNNTSVGNRLGIHIHRGNGEVVKNNIVADNAMGNLVFSNDSKNMDVDYNLCTPASEHQGPNGISGDPLFVDARRGAFWLRPGSPAIGTGTRGHAPATDFWGRRLPEDGPRDLGAFSFEPYLASGEARADWYENWAYRFAPGTHRGKSQDMVDLWRPPGKQAGKAKN